MTHLVHLALVVPAHLAVLGFLQVPEGPYPLEVQKPPSHPASLGFPAVQPFQEIPETQPVLVVLEAQWLHLDLLPLQYPVVQVRLDYQGRPLCLADLLGQQPLMAPLVLVAQQDLVIR